MHRVPVYLPTYWDFTERLCLSMLPLPITPSKVDDGIEKVKQSLSTKWGIQFPVRNPTPSKRNRSLLEEKILDLIQFLYFKEGALDCAIEQFEKNAVHIVSQWQFKPHGEPDVLPSVAHSESGLRQDFLKKQPELSHKAVTELTESLKYFLSLVVDRIKAGDKFPTSRGIKGKVSCLLSSFRQSGLKASQMKRSPQTKFRPLNLTYLSVRQTLDHGYGQRANRYRQRADNRRFSFPRRTTTQTKR